MYVERLHKCMRKKEMDHCVLSFRTLLGARNIYWLSIAGGYSTVSSAKLSLAVCEAKSMNEVYQENEAVERQRSKTVKET